MLNNLMAIIQGDGSNWAGQQKAPSNYYFDNFGEAALYALIGFIVVFAGIVIIIGIIWLVGLIMRKTDNLAFLSKKREKKADKKDAEGVKTLQSTATSDGDIPDEVKAAIVAALMAYYQEQEPQCEFTVKRIKRI
ncbi:MAG: OadG family protein [Roseburia sp.]|nr:OadG family protein [Roseburia sp.]